MREMVLIAKNKMMSVMSHEIRTHINAIDFYTDEILESSKTK